MVIFVRAKNERQIFSVRLVFVHLFSLVRADYAEGPFSEYPMMEEKCSDETKRLVAEHPGLTEQKASSVRNRVPYRPRCFPALVPRARYSEKLHRARFRANLQL